MAETTATTTAAFPRADYHDIGLCLGCGYALRGLSDTRCPECGRVFDPFDHKTMRVPGMSRKPPPKPVPFSVGIIIYSVTVALGSVVGLIGRLAGICVVALIAWAIIFGAWWGRSAASGGAGARTGDTIAMGRSRCSAAAASAGAAGPAAMS
jgi:hypothetical protein